MSNKGRFSKIYVDEIQINRMCQLAIKASKAFEGCSDGSYEGSIYYHICEEVKRLRRESEASERMSKGLQALAEESEKLGLGWDTEEDDDISRRNNGMPKV